MNPFTQNPVRLLTGLILIVVVATTLYLGGMFLAFIFLLVSLCGLWEFLSMFGEKIGGFGNRLLAMLLTVGMIAMSVCMPDSGMMPFTLVFLILALVFLFRWGLGDQSQAFQSTALVAAGIAYVPVLLLPALSCSLYEQILLICIPVFTDSAAYFCGVRFGKHKIWSKVSPKKSVEGSIAGLLAAVIITLVLGSSLGNASLGVFLFLGIFLGILAQLGDFFESALKRTRNIKDSGSLLPGHGGMLDRIDSLLFVVPGYALCKLFCHFF